MWVLMVILVLAYAIYYNLVSIQKAEKWFQDEAYRCFYVALSKKMVLRFHSLDFIKRKTYRVKGKHFDIMFYLPISSQALGWLTLKYVLRKMYRQAEASPAKGSKHRCHITDKNGISHIKDAFCAELHTPNGFEKLANGSIYYVVTIQSSSLIKLHQVDTDLTMLDGVIVHKAKSAKQALGRARSFIEERIA